ncbi:MAG: DUF4886 domain-containing protein [Clostridia bacterium]|nr:DUF4886 domain-containing protein [Clostridia bacterium]
MKRKLILIASMVLLLICAFSLVANAQCSAEHDSEWTITFGDEGYLGEISASYHCSTCSLVTSEKISPLFETLGYSYGPAGITQHYAVNREAVARYEELTGEKVRFGAVAATRSNIGTGNPLDENGNPINEKVKVADFTDTKYDIFDVIVNNIPDEYKGSVEIICCAYIIAGKEITYIENGAEKVNASANTFTRVSEKVDNKEVEEADIFTYKFIDGTKYKRLPIEDLGLSKWSYWQSDGNDYKNLQVGTGTTHKKFYATRKFTKAELPNGTMISVASGWAYRPEGWVVGELKNGQSNTPKRPDTTSASVVVSDSWWGSFETRAFNITPNATIADSTTAEQIYEKFSIFVPVANNSVTVVPDAPSTDTIKQNWEDDGALKILCIGNSFSVDSMEYVYQVAKDAGVENIVLGNLFIGGCSLDTHYTNALENKGAYTYYTNTNGTWSSKGGQKISTAVTSENWDFITFQQVSQDSGMPNTYGNLGNLIDIVEGLNPQARLVWHMTWAYKKGANHSGFANYNKDQTTMYNAIIETVKTVVLADKRIEFVIPAGTSIQNARTSYYGDRFNRDGYHLNNFGRYIGSLTFVKALTGLSIDNITFRVDDMTDNNRLLAIDSVNKAVNTPYQVTTSAYAVEPSLSVPTVSVENGVVQIPSGYRQLTLEEMGWEANSYWNRNSYNSDASVAFNTGYYASNSLTIKEIPIGSIIVLNCPDERPWQYRPDSGAGERPGNVTSQITIVNETWWLGHTTRGFNLSIAGHTDRNVIAINNYTPEQIQNVLVILVPNEEEATITPTVSSDLCVEEVTVIDGKEYRALTLDAMDIEKYCYYYSTDSTERYVDTNGTYKRFACTGKYGKDILVDGAVIFVGAGWGYRPEGWKNGELNSVSNRPTDIAKSNSAQYKTVDGSWWGTFTERGFNITNGSNLSEDVTAEDIYEIFKIYIPVENIID